MRKIPTKTGEREEKQSGVVVVFVKHCGTGGCLGDRKRRRRDICTKVEADSENPFTHASLTCAPLSITSTATATSKATTHEKDRNKPTEKQKTATTNLDVCQWMFCYSLRVCDSSRVRVAAREKLENSASWVNDGYSRDKHPPYSTILLCNLCKRDLEEYITTRAKRWRQGQFYKSSSFLLARSLPSITQHQGPARTRINSVTSFIFVVVVVVVVVVPLSKKSLWLFQS